MSYNKNLLSFFAVILVAIIAACEKINDGNIGFLSDQVRYLDDTLVLERGTTSFFSTPIDIDGSTAPVTFEVLDIRNSAGKSVKSDFLEKKYSVTAFKRDAVFNAATDTTLALLNAKRETIETPGMIFNTKSGVISMNQASENFPVGKSVIDVKVKNSAGERVYKNFRYLSIVDPDPSKVYLNNGGETVAAQSPPNGSDFIFLPNATVTVTQQSGTGTTLIVKYTDKNGVPFNPRIGEIQKRGDRPNFVNYAPFNPVIFTDTALVVKYEISPFPIAPYVDPTGINWGYNIYYRIMNTACQIDGYAPSARHVLPRMYFTLVGRGTYLMTIKLNNVTHL